MTRKGEKQKLYSNFLNYVNELKQSEVTIILEDIEFCWKNKDIDKVKNLWKANKSLQIIAAEVDRNCDEVFLLLMHLSRAGEIKKRPGYVWGK